jgi:hypothetical protein
MISFIDLSTNEIKDKYYENVRLCNSYRCCTLCTINCFSNETYNLITEKANIIYPKPIVEVKKKSQSNNTIQNQTNQSKQPKNKGIKNDAIKRLKTDSDNFSPIKTRYHVRQISLLSTYNNNKKNQESSSYITNSSSKKNKNNKSPTKSSKQASKKIMEIKNDKKLKRKMLNFNNSNNNNSQTPIKLKKSMSNLDIIKRTSNHHSNDIEICELSSSPPPNQVPTHPKLLNHSLNNISTTSPQNQFITCENHHNNSNINNNQVNSSPQNQLQKSLISNANMANITSNIRNNLSNYLANGQSINITSNPITWSISEVCNYLIENKFDTNLIYLIQEHVS